jgi:ubiquinone/menaquinone biosynthesis C-methylase UbiE
MAETQKLLRLVSVKVNRGVALDSNSQTSAIAQQPMGEPLAIHLHIAVDAPILLDVEASITLFAADPNVPLLDVFSSHQGINASWLPCGEYVFVWSCAALQLATAPLRLCVRFFALQNRVSTMVLVENLYFSASDIVTANTSKMPVNKGFWALESAPAREGATAIDVTTLGWQHQHQDWFWRHLHHAAITTMTYVCKDHPALFGRVLDVGCGDGITDLGIMLRYQPKELIGIDPFKGYERLGEVLAANQLGSLTIPDNLKFMDSDANALPFADNSFDALISWGSVEHMAGGYDKALLEMRRVLKPGGLLFIAPGLYFSNIGHHLTEFSDEPFVHLNKTEDELRDLVLNTRPKYMDRAGEFSPPAQFWQWYKELNKITVAGFEAELRALNFEPWRFAVRVEEMVEYTPSMLPHDMMTLAPSELYSCWFNRKVA